MRLKFLVRVSLFAFLPQSAVAVLCVEPFRFAHSASSLASPPPKRAQSVRTRTRRQFYRDEEKRRKEQMEARRRANADVRVIPRALFAAARSAGVPLPSGRPPTASTMAANRGRRRPAGSRKRPKKKAKKDVADSQRGQRKRASERTLRRRLQRQKQRRRQHAVATSAATSATAPQRAVPRSYRWAGLRRQWRQTRLAVGQPSHPNGIPILTVTFTTVSHFYSWMEMLAV
jgi:hypothetical protein